MSRHQRKIETTSPSSRAEQATEREVLHADQGTDAEALDLAKARLEALMKRPSHKKIMQILAR